MRLGRKRSLGLVAPISRTRLGLGADAALEAYV